MGRSQEKCAEAIAASQERAANRQLKRPPGVWWGFHYFWPHEKLHGESTTDVMDDVNFLRRVQQLMQNERIVETFSIFDVDHSGAINSSELTALVQMVEPQATPQMIDEMVSAPSPGPHAG